MHINHLHRHLVALPIVTAVFLLIAFGDHRIQTRAASLLSDRAGTQELSLRGICVVPSHDADLSMDADDSDISYAAGTVFVRALQEVRIGIPHGSISAVHGDIALTSASGTITAVAATAPMIVTVRDEQLFVPSGYEAVLSGNVMTLRSVPSIWMSLHNDAFPACELQDELANDFVSDDTLFSLLDALRLLTDGVRRDHAAQAERVIQAPASFANGIALTLLAYAETADMPVDTAFIDAWHTNAKRGVAYDPLFATTDVLPRALSLPQRFTDAFPRTAAQIRSAVDSVHALLRTQAASWHNDTLSSALTAHTSVHSSSSSASSEREDRVPANPDAVRAYARDLLLRYNALFTGDTTLTVLDETHVRVIGIYIAGEDKDHHYSFTLDTVLHEASQIERDGKRLPNAVPISAL